MLLPSLNKARAQAQKISCANNQKQIGLLTIQYASDFNDIIPARKTRIVNGVVPPQWGVCLVGAMQLPKYFYCPTASYPSGFQFGKGSSDFSMTYAIRGSLGSGADWETPKFGRATVGDPYSGTGGFTLRSMKNVAQNPYLFENVVFSNALDSTLTVGSPSYYLGMGNAGAHFRHAAQTNILFFDMHVASYQWFELDRGPLKGAAWGMLRTGKKFYRMENWQGYYY